MQAQDLMTRKLVTIKANETLVAVRNLFFRYKFHHLIVVDDDDNIAGIITDRDLFKALNPEAGSLDVEAITYASMNTKARQICSSPVISVTPEMSLEQVVQVFKENKISCVPVIGRQQRALGIISWRDIFNRV